MKVKDTGSTEYEHPKPGSFVANCFKVIDIGTQETGFKDEEGKPVIQRKVFIGWEISQKMADGRPFAVQSKFTASLHKKSVLRPFLENWRGVAFTEEQLQGFDLKKLLGASCLLSLVETEDKKYINVKGAMKIPEGMEKMQPVNEHIYFSLDEFDQATFNKFPEWLKKLIVLSPEYQNLPYAANASGDRSATSTAGVQPDDIPF